MTLYVNGRVVADPGTTGTARTGSARTGSTSAGSARAGSAPLAGSEEVRAERGEDVAIAVQGGRVLALGEPGRLRADLRDAYGAGAGQVVDLQGATVLPGFVDAHIHSALFARSLVSADLRGARSLAEALLRVDEHRTRAGSGTGWIFGTAWDHNLWEVPAVPDRHQLDSVTGAVPAALHSGDAHTWWVNTAGLRELGIDRHTPDPPGGRIEREGVGPDAEPTGILRETAGQRVEAVLAAGAAGDLVEHLGRAQHVLWSQGLTGIHDFDGEDCRQAYRELHSRGELGLRVVKSIPLTALDEAIAEGRATGAGDEWLRTGAVKIFTDGALGSHTCLMHSPMAGTADASSGPAHADTRRGVETITEDELAHVLRRASGAGIAVAAHAIGDRANSRILDAFTGLASGDGSPRAAGAAGSTGALRHRIEHAQHLSPADLPRLAALGVVASMQPVHATADFELVSELLAGHRLASYAWRSLLDAGARLAFGSDAPVETPSPLAGIHAAVTRQRTDGHPAGGWQPEQRISRAEAIVGYTSGPAYAAGEPAAGRIAPGSRADFTLLREDPFAVAAADLADLPVAGVVTGGRLRHWA